MRLPYGDLLRQVMKRIKPKKSRDSTGAEMWGLNVFWPEHFVPCDVYEGWMQTCHIVETCDKFGVEELDETYGDILFQKTSSAML